MNKGLIAFCVAMAVASTFAALLFTEVWPSAPGSAVCVMVTVAALFTVFVLVVFPPPRQRRFRHSKEHSLVEKPSAENDPIDDMPPLWRTPSKGTPRSPWQHVGGYQTCASVGLDGPEDEEFYNPSDGPRAEPCS